MKIRVQYCQRANAGEAYKDQPPKIVDEKEFNRMCEDKNCFILRTGIVLNEEEEERVKRMIKREEEKEKREGKKERKRKGNEEREEGGER